MLSFVVSVYNRHRILWINLQKEVHEISSLITKTEHFFFEFLNFN